MLKNVWSDQEPVKKGQQLFTSTGEYSDYSVRGFFVAAKDFAPDEVMNAYLSAHPDKDGDYKGHVEELTVWLVTEGYLIEAESTRELHAGDYGTFRAGWMQPKPPRQPKKS